MGRGAFYVTTPIYYPNDRPHIGHAYTTIMADVAARWHRLLGDEVFFLTGTDEHGLKLQREAERRGVHPKKFVDEMAEIYKEYWRILYISYDRFIRTTDPDHEDTVRNALLRLYRKGLIYRGRYRGWYCTSCERFYPEGEYIVREGRRICPIHLKELELVEEDTYFLKLSDYTPYVVEALKQGRVIPEEYANEVVSKLTREGLKDLSITRPKHRVYWGIEAPWDPSHTIYVWIDALMNYLTAVEFLRNDARFEKYWSEAHHLIGKDILWFHTAIWFALLKMLDVPPPKKVVVHGFILVRGAKMGKSLGNVVRIEDLLSAYGSPDAVRYLLMRFSSLEKDLNYDPVLFANAYNGELADTLGNLVRRVGILALRKLEGAVPRSEVDHELDSLVKNAVPKIVDLMNSFKFSEALIAIFDLLRAANAYLNKTEPWKLQDPTRPLYNVLEVLRIAAIALQPFMPKAMEVLAGSMGFKIESAEDMVMGVVDEYKVKEAPILFRKISPSS